MKLGKRYVALVAVPVRHPDDDGPGYSYVVHYNGRLYETERGAARQADDRSRQARYALGIETTNEGKGRTLTVDLDELYARQHAPSVEGAERRFIGAYADLQAIRPDARPDDLVLAELARLRAQVAQMMPVVEAAMAWRRDWPNPAKAVNSLRDAVDDWTDAFPKQERSLPRGVK